MFSKHNDVLLGQKGRWYSEQEKVLFSSERPIWGVALAGLPGSKGYIQVSVFKSNMRQSREDLLTLHIYFQLRPCHLGFLDPIVTTREDVCARLSCNTALLARMFATRSLIQPGLSGKPAGCWVGNSMLQLSSCCSG